MKIPLLDLQSQYKQIKDEINQAIVEVLESGNYIMGRHVENFEQNMAQFLQVKHAVGVASGSDALLLSLHALGISQGDHVIVPTFTFFATAGAVSRLGALPIFVDISPADCNLDLDHVEKTLHNDKKVKAIIPVHIFGRPCDMEKLMALAERFGVKIVEDACQAIDAELDYQGEKKKAGTIGITGCFSFFPSKNLGCYGDGGMIVTNDDKLAESIRILRVHGSKPKYYHKVVGYNSRLDSLQAAILNVKLKYLPSWTEKRRKVALKYDNAFKNVGLDNRVVLPQVTEGHVFHQYVIAVNYRDQLQKHLGNNGIGTAIYYPLPLHLQECFGHLGYKPGDLPISEEVCNKVLALPIDPELNNEQIDYIVNSIKEFYIEKGI